MKNNYKKILVILNLIILIGAFTFSVIREENNLKKEGFYLELAPVDPRSLLQGDYMILNYDIYSNIYKESEKNEEYNFKGYVILKLDDKNVARFVKIEKDIKNLENSSIAVSFYKSGWEIKMGIESFLFQEGEGKKYEEAEYAEVILIKNNKLRIKQLLDKDFKVIK